MARELDLDLVEVAPQRQPAGLPGHGLRQVQVRGGAEGQGVTAQEASSISIKEMKYRPKIGQGDFDTKTRKVAEFLGEGHKVKVTIMFRGREVLPPRARSEDPRPGRGRRGEHRQGRGHARARRAQHDDGARPRPQGAPAPKKREHRPRASAAPAPSTNGTPDAAEVSMTDVVVSLPLAADPAPVTEVAATVEQPEPTPTRPERDLHQYLGPPSSRRPEGTTMPKMKTTRARPSASRPAPASSAVCRRCASTCSRRSPRTRTRRLKGDGRGAPERRRQQSSAFSAER